MPSLKALSAFQRDSNSSEVFYDLIEGISPLGWKWKVMVWLTKRVCLEFTPTVEKICVVLKTKAWNFPDWI